MGGPQRTNPKSSRFLLIAALIVITSAASIPVPAQETVELGSPPEEPTAWRYVWLDADGRPLPFQSDQEIEEFLREAKIVKTTRLKDGVTEPLKLLLERDGVRAHAVFKDVDRSQRSKISTIAGEKRRVRHWRDFHAFDCASYRLDRLLGIGRVPPSVRRKRGATHGTATMWLEQTMPEAKRQDLGLEPPDILRWNRQKILRALYDNLVYDMDSNLGNTLIDRGWNHWWIDCSRCFNRSPDPLQPQMVDHCERGLWKALNTVEDATIREGLDPWLTAAEINGLLARRARLVEHLGRLIASRGEAAVLYEIEPFEGEPAPWPD